jgi:hypothetical protein
MRSLQLAKSVELNNSIFNPIRVNKSALANGVMGRVFALALVIIHGLHAGPSLANTDQVQKQDPVLAVEFDAPVMQRVLKCDLESQSDLIEFLSSLSIKSEPVTHKQSGQEGNECVDVLVHEATYLLSWFFAGLAISFALPLLRNGKSKSKGAASGFKAPGEDGA